MDVTDAEMTGVEDTTGVEIEVEIEAEIEAETAMNGVRAKGRVLSGYAVHARTRREERTSW